MLGKLRGLILPLLSMLAVIGAVYLVAKYWPGERPGRMPDKVKVVHRAAAAQAAADATTETNRTKPRLRPPVGSEHWSTSFDEYFRKYTKRFFGVGFDWRWFKAQAIVESTLNPRAHSNAGAVGLMQIKPSTFRDIRKRKPYIHNLHSPRWNIAAGIGYVRHLYDKDAIRVYPNFTRLYLSFASYNAGYSRMLRIIRKVPPAEVGWQETLEHAPRQARHYVTRIIAVKTGES